jgi:SAM-dependent methyltransferase
MIVDEIKERFVEDTNYNMQDPYPLHWHPSLPENRDKHYGMLHFMREKFKDKRTLEIGYRWAGRFFHNSKVLDLYDPRPDIDYRIDICNAKIIPDNSFDLINCISVLEHIPKFWKAAEEIQRILAKDGILICGIPAVWPYHPFCGNQNMGGDYWRVTHEGLVSLFDKLTKVTVYYVPAARTKEEPMTFGWGCCYIGVKNE